MKKEYKYRNIRVFQNWGFWYADYLKDVTKPGELNRFALHRVPCDTKEACYRLARQQVDALNARRKSNYE